MNQLYVYIHPLPLELPSHPPLHITPLDHLRAPYWWLRCYRICLQCRRPRFDPWVGKIPWRREWLPTPVFSPGEFHGQNSVMGYSPWGCKEPYMTEQLTLPHPYIIYMVMYICQTQSPNSSHTPSPPTAPVSTSPFSTSASLFLPCR